MHITFVEMEMARLFKLEYGPNYAQTPERRQELWLKFRAEYQQKHGIISFPVRV